MMPLALDAPRINPGKIPSTLAGLAIFSIIGRGLYISGHQV